MSNAIVPIPRVAVSVRAATIDDLPFIDSLQKRHTKMVGWMPEKALIGKIKLGHVIVAEENGTADYADSADLNSESAKSVQSVVATPLGYCIGNDQYFKRDDLGIIYQVNVVPGKHRSLIGATLVKAMFERAAYGCKLFCCWCAQDLEANRFWESLGFVPLAFRTGAVGKKGVRTHIFWQRRIREGDTTTPYWFPAKTDGGAMREDRLVLPIPPGVHWRDPMPTILPQQAVRQLTNETKSKAPPKPRQVSPRYVQFGPPTMTPQPAMKPEQPKREKPKKTKTKVDGKYLAAARELRDRWLEHVNEMPILPAGKYDVARALVSAVKPVLVSAVEPAIRALPQAA